MPTNSNVILVVGGAGYIGSHMVLMLKQAGFIPIVLDDLSKGHRDAVLDTKLIVGTIADKELLAYLFAEYPFFAVMHFASYIEVAESMQFPLKYYQNNVAATCDLLEIMLKNKVQQFIFSSSAAVYGTPQYTPIDEAHILQPINPYGRSKRMIEEVVSDLGQSDGLQYAILRYFNAAGADPEGRLRERHDPESHLIPLALQVAMGQRDSITVYGRDYPTVDETCVRDYVHVVDICRAHLQALKRLQGKKSNLICNLGSGQGYSVQQVIEAVRQVTGHPIPITEGTRRAGDPPVLVADATLAKKELGWQAEYSELKIIIQHAWQNLQHASKRILTC
jgi:UDP-glucose 4-epimerase